VAAPQTFLEAILVRVAGFCAGQKLKTLIVCRGAAHARMLRSVANLEIGAFVDVLELPESVTTPLDVDPGYRIVLIAADNSGHMLRVLGLCGRYKAAGIPVLAVDGWPPPIDARHFAAEAKVSGEISVPGMFDVASGYCRNGTTGDILEFGTFQGFTLQCAYHAFNHRGNLGNRRFIAFDSFAGIIGTKEGEGFYDGAYAASEASLKFANFLAQVPDERVVIVKGPYSETLRDRREETRAALGETSAAIVHIDCDVEDPAKMALDFVTPYVKQGTLLMFDEYDMQCADNSKGERAALRAWLRENPQFEVEPYRAYHLGARSFILHKN